jgi:hypothetical protein
MIPTTMISKTALTCSYILVLLEMSSYLLDTATRCISLLSPTTPSSSQRPSLKHYPAPTKTNCFLPCTKSIFSFKKMELGSSCNFLPIAKLLFANGPTVSSMIPREYQPLQSKTNGAWVYTMIRY